MNDKPANRHRDLRSLIRDDATPNYLEFPTFDESKDFDPVPAVQGEPVAWMHNDPSRVDVIHESVRSLLKNSAESAGHLHRPLDRSERYTIPLYTAPQPAEQQPISHDWDDQDKCRRCGDRDWYASATCSPKQQPAPDVAGLVEALEDVVSYHAEVYDSDKPLMANYSEMMRKVRGALAAHRKQQEPSHDN